LANNARQLLKRRLAAGKTGLIASKHLYNLKDDRQPKRPGTPYTRFVAERHGSGDLKGINNNETLKLIGAEWKALSAAEKEVCDPATLLNNVETC
jgi:hypothetical protein